MHMVNEFDIIRFSFWPIAFCNCFMVMIFINMQIKKETISCLEWHILSYHYYLNIYILYINFFIALIYRWKISILYFENRNINKTRKSIPMTSSQLSCLNWSVIFHTKLTVDIYIQVQVYIIQRKSWPACPPSVYIYSPTLSTVYTHWCTFVISIYRHFVLPHQEFPFHLLVKNTVYQNI